METTETSMPVAKLENGARLISFDTSRGRQVAAAQNFTVEWVDAGQGGARFESRAEAIVIFPESAGAVTDPKGRTIATEAAVIITPPGRYEVVPEGSGIALILTTDRPDLDAATLINAGEVRNGLIAPIGQPFARKSPLVAPEVRTIAAIEAPEGNRRIKFIQSETISINLVLYDGPRGKGALSPHSHADIEQGSLAVAGQYVHHMRTPWGKDGALWLDDAHLQASAGTMILIPPELIHTSEGVGAKAHFLIDIFAPPRRDFIGKGWVFNSADYIDPAAS